MKEDGNRIWINYGNDPAAMTVELMEQAGVGEHLKPGMRVCIKPNLVVARPADGGATTHPEVVEGIVQYLQSYEVKDITVAEGSWVGDNTREAFQTCGYRDLERRYGVRLLDTKADPARKISSHGVGLKICQSLLETDFLINVPVLKAHCQTDVTCCLKNLKGCIPDGEKRRYHTMGLHHPIAALAAALKPHLHVVDSICGDLTFEEGGNPVVCNRILLGYDGLQMDRYCAGLLGYQPEEIEYLRLLSEWEGISAEAPEVTELNTEQRPKQQEQPSRIAQKLAAHIDEDSACSACYAALVFALHKLGGNPAGEPVRIGQGFRGRVDGFIGVGNCTRGCRHNVPGCPPRAADIVQTLQGVTP